VSTPEDRASFLLAELCDAVDRLLGLAMHDRAVALLETPSTRRLGSPPLRAKTPSVRAVLAGEKRDEPSPDRTPAWTGAWLALIQRTDATPGVDLWEKIDRVIGMVWDGLAECHGLTGDTAKRLLEEFAWHLSSVSGTQHSTLMAIPEYADWDELWAPHLWLSVLLALGEAVPTVAQDNAPLAASYLGSLPDWTDEEAFEALFGQLVSQMHCDLSYDNPGAGCPCRATEVGAQGWSNLAHFAALNTFMEHGNWKCAVAVGAHALEAVLSGKHAQPIGVDLEIISGCWAASWLSLVEQASPGEKRTAALAAHTALSTLSHSLGLACKDPIDPTEDSLVFAATFVPLAASKLDELLTAPAADLAEAAERARADFEREFGSLLSTHPGRFAHHLVEASVARDLRRAGVDAKIALPYWSALDNLVQSRLWTPFLREVYGGEAKDRERTRPRSTRDWWRVLWGRPKGAEEAQVFTCVGRAFGAWLADSYEDHELIRQALQSRLVERLNRPRSREAHWFRLPADHYTTVEDTVRGFLEGAPKENWPDLQVFVEKLARRPAADAPGEPGEAG
jgi:hypothetical protein